VILFVVPVTLLTPPAVAAAKLPSSFWIACKILSVAKIVPVVEVNPVNTFPITALLESVTEIPVVPLPEASPLNVMDWFPVKYVFVSTVHVPAPLVLRNPDVPVKAAIAVKSASNGCPPNPANV